MRSHVEGELRQREQGELRQREQSELRQREQGVCAVWRPTPHSRTLRVGARPLCLSGGSQLRQTHDFSAARSLLKMWASDDKAKENHELWLRWERAERAAGEHKKASGVH